MVGEWSLADTDCAQYLNGRGIGARYDGSYPGSPWVGDCQYKTGGDGSSFSNEFKGFLRQFWDVQTVSNFSALPGSLQLTLHSLARADSLIANLRKLRPRMGILDMEERARGRMVILCRPGGRMDPIQPERARQLHPVPVWVSSESRARQGEAKRITAILHYTPDFTTTTTRYRFGMDTFVKPLPSHNTLSLLHYFVNPSHNLLYMSTCMHLLVRLPACVLSPRRSNQACTHDAWACHSHSCVCHESPV